MKQSALSKKIQNQSRRSPEALEGDKQRQLRPLSYILGEAYARQREKRGIQGKARRNPEALRGEKLKN
jgi:hypothetical protein